MDDGKMLTYDDLERIIDEELAKANDCNISLVGEKIRKMRYEIFGHCGEHGNEK